jgi:hypothetical protein
MNDNKTLLIAWVGILLAPLTWIIAFEINYVTVPFACQSGSKILHHLVSMTALTFAGVGWMAARRAWTDTGKIALTDEADAIHRNGFLGMFGLLFSGILILLIVAQWIPVLLVDPCSN